MGRSKEMAIEMAEKEAKAASLEEAAAMLKEQMALREQTPWEMLHDIDVTPNIIRKKCGYDKETGKEVFLDYLPWPIIYEVFNKLFEGDWDVEEIDDERTGNNYFTDGRTAWVKTRIRVHGQWRECSLPVMDNRNNSIMIDKLTSRDINDSLQRCKVKNACYWGLGTDIYTKLDTIEILTHNEYEQKRAEAEERRIAEYSNRLSQAISSMQMCQTIEALNTIMNNYRDLWQDDAFRTEGAAVKARLIAA